jgi:hypothetical protein
MHKKFPTKATLLAALLAAGPAAAEMAPSMSLSGLPGLIDMPSGTALPDGWMGLNYSTFGPVSRSTLSFQITPRLLGSFRYVAVREWNDKACPPKCNGLNSYDTYYDRNFDLRYQLLDEGKYLPSVAIGLQDFIGTGLSMGEYLVASKTIGDNLRVTGGIGFGRLASDGAIGTLFGKRAKVDFGNGGTVNSTQWFRGEVAPFGGIEYKFGDKWVFKAEYSSDAYVTEASSRETFERKSPVNFGIEYQSNAHVRFGAYSLYGSEIGLNLSILLDPAQRPNGGVGGAGPAPMGVRPSFAQNPAIYITGWVDDADAKTVLIDRMNKRLEREKITIESLAVTPHLAQVRYRNSIYDASAQGVGRVARAMSLELPSSVDTFEIVPVSNGLAGAKVVVQRTDLEQLEYTPDPAGSLRARTVVTAAGSQVAGATKQGGLYPSFNWSIGPNTQVALFARGRPVQFVFSGEASAKYELAPGFYLSGTVSQLLFGKPIVNPNDNNLGSLPPVRSRADEYLANDGLALQNLTAAWYRQLGPELYGRLTFGYLEKMYGGISSEVLYQPVNKRWALGADVNYVAQRNTDGGFGFDEFDYRVTTGHVSGYYDLGNGYDVELDVGRYLAGDVGGTLTLTRYFSNGFKVGAFMTRTNVSAKEFGEGSFDKGIVMELPLTYFSGQPSRTIKPAVLRPLGRDGGARLQVNDRLRATLRGTDQSDIDAQWGRFWK